MFKAKALIHKKTLIKTIKSKIGLKTFNTRFEKKIRVKKRDKKNFCLNRIGFVFLNSDFGISIAKTLGKPKLNK